MNQNSAEMKAHNQWASRPEWLNHFQGAKYYEVLCQCVWAYPEGSLFGCAVNLFTGNIYQ